MATLNITNVMSTQSPLTPPRMVMAFDSGSHIAINRAPRILSATDIGHEFAMSNRAGRRGVLRHQSEKTPMIKMQFHLGEQDIRTSVQTQLNQLIWAAQKKTRVYIIYTPSESGAWQITNFSYDVNDREPENNEPSRVLVDIEFTLIEPKKGSQIGPLTGGMVGDSPSTPAPTPTPFPAYPPTPPPAPANQARSYTMKKGDTLWGISIKYYGAGVYWTRLADANGITNPRKIPIGTVIRIP